MQNKNKTVVKSMKLLDLFRTNWKLSLNEIVELSGIPKTSVHRMLGSLEDMGLLHKDHEGKYTLGMLFLEFGQLVADRLDMRQLAYPMMKELRDEIGEAVNLTMIDNMEAIYIEKLDTLHPVRLYTKVGRRSPLYAGACSRIILAHLPESEIETYLKETELKPIGIGTITDKQKLRTVLQQSKLDGYTISYSELEDHTSSVAAPIFDYTNKVVGGLSIAGPDVRFPKEHVPHIIEKVKRTAAEISQKLGYSNQK
ncbi:IclR family transcriptional regulator [Anaerobacillus alkalidiazotrophicus]|uniref:IclR family transcriptional regulator n=1 Tax=Anaerobacillus alkalidiazotrophicus TaxID=472963 RepID=A0A1S2M7Y0_9BACI|nr:IclR family transcriptional regulator [Anaerobacillus alkalidiazotrophicus]OIJ20771.1 IclR family transcriptional regulator [Anaerobacillus alkalidiazotrophicus]